MPNPAAGWYPDPGNAAQRRYWDGTRWTEHTDAGGQQPAAGQPAAQRPGPQGPASPQAPAATPAAIPAAGAQVGGPQWSPATSRPAGVAPAKPGPPGIGIAGFVCGLVGLILSVTIICWFIGLPLAIVGAVLGAIGVRQSNERGAPKGLSMAGMICGIVGTVAAIGVTVAVVLAS